MATEIILDAGHGELEEGFTYGDRAEKDEVLNLTLAVGKKLEDAGYIVKYIRTNDEYVSPYQKVEDINCLGGDIFISFHRNSAMEKNLHDGVQALVNSSNSLEAAAVGESINEQLETVGFKNLGVKTVPDLIVLKNTQMPAVLMEVGFINSDRDNQIWDEHFGEIVQAIVTGIENMIPDSMRQQSAPGGYYVQTGQFEYDINATYQLERLNILGYGGVIHYEKPYYEVWIGSIGTLEEAAQIQKQLRVLGYRTLIVTES